MASSDSSIDRLLVAVLLFKDCVSCHSMVYFPLLSLVNIPLVRKDRQTKLLGSFELTSRSATIANWKAWGIISGTVGLGTLGSK